MALNFIAGLAIGFGAGLLAPKITPAVKPLAKSAIKAGLITYDQARVTLAELNENTEDAIAEVRSEMEEERKVAGG
ncbi:DUF5132 domain-containing protein [Rhizobium sullae]|uniref:Uncharacterized protein DUF5132 n=1 Tax=Rhizobium sullae TaxID=50338 RepID=A0A4R3PSA4_RHISU|nr:DUF5132 domain-containing protein [Rhizobium sullae]TCU04845.1 uncharacterized protein DUF5132 [Rhizobium sullae]